MEKKERQWMINQAYNDLVNQIRLDLRDKILDDIEKRIVQMRKVLDNGVPFLENTFGDRFMRIFDARQKVWTKIAMLDEMYSTILVRY